MTVILSLLLLILPLHVSASAETTSLAASQVSLIDDIRVKQIGADKIIIELSGRAVCSPKPISADGCAAAFEWRQTVLSLAGQEKHSRERGLELKYDFPLAQRINFFVNDRDGLTMAITGVKRLRLKDIVGEESSDSLTLFLETFPPSITEEKKTAETSGQALFLDEKVTLEMYEISLAEALRMLAASVGMDLVMSAGIPSGKISLSFQETPFADVLGYLLRSNSLAHAVRGNTLIVGLAQSVAETAGINETRAYHIAYAEVPQAAALLGTMVGQIKTITVDERTRALYVTGTAEQHEEIEALLDVIDRPVRQIMLEARLIEVNKLFKQDIESMLSAIYHGWLLSSGIGGGRLGYAYTNRELPSNNGSGAMDSAIKMLDAGLRAMELEQKGKILAAPSIVALDGHKAVIKLTRSYLYQSSVDEHGNAKFREQETGPSLEITPLIGRDGFMTMKLRISSGEIVGFRKSGTSETPETSRREVDTCVRIRDGELFVIGGLYSESKNKNVIRTPVLSDIPLIGGLFTSRSEARLSSELAFIVVPHIIDIHSPGRAGFAADSNGW